MRRWLYGWQMWLWAIGRARAKKHGAGPQKWEHALKTAACVRYIVDGQQRDPPRLPRYLRKTVR